MKPTLTTKARELLAKAAHKELSDHDKKLLKKYPRHTLEQAREIDAADGTTPEAGILSGFEQLQIQERRGVNPWARA